MQRRLGLDLQVPDDFGFGLAWFTAGEGHFGATIRRRKSGYKTMNLLYGINLRADDAPALEYIRDTLGVGQVYIYEDCQRRSPLARYKVFRAGDLYHVIVPLFEEYPIPSQFRKAKDFEIWKKIVEIHYHQGGPQALGVGPIGKPGGSAPLPQSYWDKVEPLVEELKSGRRFRP